MVYGEENKYFAKIIKVNEIKIEKKIFKSICINKSSKKHSRFSDKNAVKHRENGLKFMEMKMVENNNFLYTHLFVKK